MNIKKKISALIFDMDGVLIDSEKLWAVEEINFTQKLIPNFPAQMQKKLCGLSQQGAYLFLKKNFGLNLTEKEFWKQRNNFAIEKIYKKTNLMPGVLEFIKKQKLPMAVASSSPHEWISIVMKRFDLKKYFQEIISADDVAGVGKPAPDIFLFTAKKLNIEPQKCLVFEDSEHGVEAAKKAQMQVFGFKNGFNDNQNLEKSDQIFDSWKNLT